MLRLPLKSRRRCQIDDPRTKACSGLDPGRARFADDNVHQSNESRARSDSVGMERALTNERCADDTAGVGGAMGSAPQTPDEFRRTIPQVPRMSVVLHPGVSARPRLAPAAVSATQACVPEAVGRPRRPAVAA